MTASQELQGQTRNMALLIDGDNALLHAYHTTSGWTTSRGVGHRHLRGKHTSSLNQNPLGDTPTSTLPD